MNRLEWFHIAGYKTIRNLEPKFELKNLNVLIGANGCGKSNFISLLRMLTWQFAAPSGKLQEFVSLNGGANAILHDGSKITDKIEIDLEFKTDLGFKNYECILSYAAGDTLVFKEEWYQITDSLRSPILDKIDFGQGHRESKLIDRADLQGDQNAKAIISSIRNIKIYQFHDTSFHSRLRGKWNVNDYRELKEDGANLAPFLLQLKTTHPLYYRVIIDTIRMIVPFFEDFELFEEQGYILLRWREKGTDQLFNASQASDGLLRAMALVTLLAQPPNQLPDIMIIDEPELGLHPSAISIIAGMIRNVARKVQVIVATQSVSLIDEFEPDDIVVVERPKRETIIKRLNTEELDVWLEAYSISELWEKNVIGGKP